MTQPTLEISDYGKRERDDRGPDYRPDGSGASDDTEPGFPVPLRRLLQRRESSFDPVVDGRPGGV